MQKTPAQSILQVKEGARRPGAEAKEALQVQMLERGAGCCGAWYRFLQPLGNGQGLGTVMVESL